MKFTRTHILMTTLAIGLVSLGGMTLSAAAQGKSATVTKTVAGLRAAYKGETTASAKYSAYATTAQKEGLPGIAHLLRATSDAEAIHARNHRQVLETLGVPDPEPGSYTETPRSTRENLKAAVQGEVYERDTMYPRMLKEARAEGQPGAVRTFTFAREAERQHAALYTRSLNGLTGKTPKTTAVGRYSVCQDCGATYFEKSPAHCTVCKAPNAHIASIE